MYNIHNYVCLYSCVYTKALAITKKTWKKPKANSSSG